MSGKKLMTCFSGFILYTIHLYFESYSFLFWLQCNLVELPDLHQHQQTSQPSLQVLLSKDFLLTCFKFKFYTCLLGCCKTLEESLAWTYFVKTPKKMGLWFKENVVNSQNMGSEKVNTQIPFAKCPPSNNPTRIAFKKNSVPWPQK